MKDTHGQAVGQLLLPVRFKKESTPPDSVECPEQKLTIDGQEHEVYYVLSPEGFLCVRIVGQSATYRVSLESIAKQVIPNLIEESTLEGVRALPMSEILTITHDLNSLTACLEEDVLAFLSLCIKHNPSFERPYGSWGLSQVELLDGGYEVSLIGRHGGQDTAFSYMIPGSWVALYEESPECLGSHLESMFNE